MKKHDLCVEYDKKAHSSSINLTVGFIYASTLNFSDCLYSYLHLLINKLVRFAAILALGMLTVNPAWAASAIQPQVRDFIEGMVERYAFDRRELEAAFGQVNILPDALKLISAPSSPISWNKYRERFVNQQRISGGVNFWRRHVQALAKASQIYGVPEEIIVAIIGIETNYGTSTGNYRVIDTLTTLAFQFPRRADYFREELAQYFLLSREQGFDVMSTKGSYAGAIGIPQFMPGSYRRYAIDFDGDGKINLSGNVNDAIGSVGNYLKIFGWQENGPIVLPAQKTSEDFLKSIEPGIEPLHSINKLRQAGIVSADSADDESLAALIVLGNEGREEFWLGLNNFYVITRYNRSTFYAMSVYALAEAIRIAKNS
ncbi:Membrane-bound lytic murein transglycosylase B [Nitrosomonas mobilis]|uniref:Membrane-bound lytic murein transglycosylase B n=2 Tax=Nitrosomonas mobilis TaxID=51642 RepID=A0A1G5SE83_9PROT|nr:Membrane-bound lytic murein transglycosylase B [Nitrosomonas mobilis]